jgi:hypothetical protein
VTDPEAQRATLTDMTCVEQFLEPSDVSIKKPPVKLVREVEDEIRLFRRALPRLAA